MLTKNIVTLASYRYTDTGCLTLQIYQHASRFVVIQVGSAVSYLYADQLGSTVRTSGVQAAERYEPYGAKRGTDTVPTTYRYTGQREESTLGLYDYGARWYDPTIGRFIQADSIVPEPGNPQSLNRYSYVLNNPLRYTDPSGNVWRDEGGNQFFSMKHQLEHKYDWSFWGNWNLGQMQAAYYAGWAIETYVNDIRMDSSGENWVKENLGGTNMILTSGTSMGPTRNIVLFNNSFETGYYGYGQTEAVAHVLHELGHLVDNKVASDRHIVSWAVGFGGGPAEDLYKSQGGIVPPFDPTSGGLKYMFNTPVEFARGSEYSYFTKHPYGNNSPADYFAETFALSVQGIDEGPLGASAWMARRILMGWEMPSLSN